MPPPPRKTPWSRPLADLVGAAIDPVLARQGFSESELILHWDDIVGERLAASSRPIKLQWPPRAASRVAGMPAQTAVLHVRVESAFAIELQHMADRVLDRINGYLGWRCVGRLLFKQGPIERNDRRAARTGRPCPERLAAANAIVAGVEDEPLRAALALLGARIAERAGSAKS
jgi:hypothetical protein